MVQPVVHGTLSSSHSLSIKPKSGHHCQSAVLDLLQFQLIQIPSPSPTTLNPLGLLTPYLLRETERVKYSSWVPAVPRSRKNSFQSYKGARLSLALRLSDVHPSLGLHPTAQQQLNHQQSSEGDPRVLCRYLPCFIPLWNGGSQLVEHLHPTPKCLFRERGTEGTNIPASPVMARRPWMISAWTYHFKAWGSFARPRGSYPKSPTSLK